MKNVYEVLSQKELELSRLEKEVEALRVAAPLLSEDKEAGNDNKPTLATSAATQQPIRIPQTAVNASAPAARAAGCRRPRRSGAAPGGGGAGLFQPPAVEGRHPGGRGGARQDDRGGSVAVAEMGGA